MVKLHLCDKVVLESHQLNDVKISRNSVND